MNEETDFNDFVLSNMPHFIAVNYRRLLEAPTPQQQVRLSLHIYNLGLRVLTIGQVSQYLIRDKEKVSDPYLNELLLQKFPHLTLDAWQKLFFTTLRSYEGYRDPLFMPELYDFYWDTSTLPHKRKAEAEQPFERLTQISMEFKIKKLLPENDDGWESLAAETKTLLQQILQNMAFLKNYDLLRVLNCSDLYYDFEMHKGLEITFGQQLLSKDIELTRGWFYLREGTDEFLLMHPLLVFWEETSQKDELIPTDTGVYDRFIYERLQYLLAGSDTTIVDDKSVMAFVTLLFDTIEETKRKRQETEKLSWWQLCDICANISTQRMATVRDKYNQQLYLQREIPRQAFEQFLVSNKKCFVLIGKSGVGKSNFFLALGDEMMQSDADICVLMYDGANLKVKPSLTEVISQDFDERLILADRRIQNVWRKIAQIDGIEGRLVILYVDAINENPQAKELLRQLDELVQKPWPWLKVVFSSRPETWQVVKRGVKLAEALYYREVGTDKLGVELEPFSYSQEMEPFSRQELPTAYAKYQQAFQLQTDYADLSNELREMLRDPLSLWLVAQTYKKESIPKKLKTTEVIAKYVKMLIDSERLHRNDRRLLEKELAPLLVKNRQFSNALTIVDIDAAGGQLYERLYSEQVLSNGQRVNQSFTNLLDADILVKQGAGQEQKIAFKYERFYEYFVGRYLVELSQAQEIQPDFFQNMVNQTNQVPFLWGAVKHALIQETLEQGSETVLTLCFTDDQRVKEMMVNVLIEYGRDNPAELDVILKTLLPPDEKMGRFQSIRQLLGKIDVTTDIHTRNARKIAVEVASQLEILWVLQTVALQADPSIRIVSLRNSYLLWQHKPEIGFEILEKLAQNSTPGLIPNFTAFESFFGLSLLILFDHFNEQQTMQDLQNSWRQVISKILGVKSRQNPLTKVLRTFIREQIISVGFNVIFRLFQEHQTLNSLNQSVLVAFFQLGSKEKETFIKLTQYIDVDKHFTQKQIEEDFLAGIKIRNWIVWGVIFTGLSMQAVKDPVFMLPVLKKLFHEAENDPTPNAYLLLVTTALRNVLYYNPFLDDVFEFFVDTIEINHDYYIQYSNIPGFENFYPREVSRALTFAPYILTKYQRTGTVKDDDWIISRIEAAFERNDIPFFDFLLNLELPVVSIEQKHPKAALETLELFFGCKNVEINNMIESFLARLDSHYPDEVDDFLETQKASDEFILHVQTNEPVETIGELIGERAWYFLMDALLASSVIRTSFVKILVKATDSSDAREWVGYMLQEIINLIYGEDILHASE